jgi:hypothetical protein
MLICFRFRAISTADSFSLYGENKEKKRKKTVIPLLQISFRYVEIHSEPAAPVSFVIPCLDYAAFFCTVEAKERHLHLSPPPEVL